MAHCDRELRRRDVISTSLLVQFEGLQHKQVALRVYKKLVTQENMFVNYDVRGKRLGEYLEGPYQHADR